jgi:hypothetical protein
VATAVALRHQEAGRYTARLSETDEDEVREMFLRLQNGTTLKAQERRNAMPGKMRDFIKNLAEHPFFHRGLPESLKSLVSRVADELRCANGGR